MADQRVETTQSDLDFIAYVVGGVGMFIGAFFLYIRVQAQLLELSLRATAQVEEAAEATTRATEAVHAEVRRLATETARAQRLAVWVGVGTAVLGAVIGGFAGAVAARIVGG